MEHIDVHAHFMPGKPLPGDLAKIIPRAPQVMTTTDRAGQVKRGNAIFRHVESTLWDTSHRLSAMEQAQISIQVLSPMPVTLDFPAPSDAYAAYCRWFNRSLGEAVREGAGRLIGLGLVPLDTPAECLAALDMIQDLGLSGVEIGTRISDRDLDDPALHYFFAEVERRGLSVLIHPVDGGGGAIRRNGFLYDFGLGMTTDTALAATALVFGGVLTRFPDLSICMVHGCGTFTTSYPRLRLGATIQGSHTADELDQLVSKLFVDSLVFDPQVLPSLIQRFGEKQIVFGTDFPFIPGQPASGIDELKIAENTLGPEVVQKIRYDNALRFLKLPMTADQIVH